MHAARPSAKQQEAKVSEGNRGCCGGGSSPDGELPAWLRWADDGLHRGALYHWTWDHSGTPAGGEHTHSPGTSLHYTTPPHTTPPHPTPHHPTPLQLIPTHPTPTHTTPHQPTPNHTISLSLQFHFTSLQDFTCWAFHLCCASCPHEYLLDPCLRLCPPLIGMPSTGSSLAC